VRRRARDRAGAGARGWAARIAAFANGVDREAARKPLTVSFHYRRDADEESAVRELEAVAEQARAAGLHPRWGRKVLEVRPPVAADKGTAVRALLERARLRRALYAGDDATDLDGFRALDGLDLAVRLAIVTDESPAGLREAADVTVGDPAELLELLRLL
jgi:trehalose 6-phosphate phosphatase